MNGFGVYRGFDKSRIHGWFISVARGKKRPKQYFKSEKERDDAYDAKIKEVRRFGLDAVAELTANDRLLIGEIRRLTPDGMSPMDVFQRGLQQVGSVSIRGLTFEQAALGLMQDQDLRLAENKISAVRYKEVKNLVLRFNGAFGNKPLSLINRTFVKTYLAGLKVAPQSRVNIAKNLSFAFNWFMAEGMVFSNPVPEQEGVARIPSYFSNDQVNEFFEAARSHFPSLLPILYLQWYAGLRPGATHHTLWEHLDFERRRIVIPPHGNKLRQPDVVQDLPPTVFALLRPFAQPSGQMAPAGHADLNKALHGHLGYRGANQSGLPVKRWPQDVARHTFASNLVSLYDQDLKRVKNVLLHSTERMLLKHYLVKNVPLELAATYFQSGLPRC